MKTLLSVAGAMVVVAFILLMLPSRSLPVSAPDVKVSVHENTLRDRATFTVMPECPMELAPDFLPAVAVARVYLDLDGRVAAVEPLEAPSTAVADGLSATLMRWRFSVNDEDRVNRRFTSGRLTFYYTLRANGCAVVNPSEAPLYSEWPAGITPRQKQSVPGAV